MQQLLLCGGGAGRDSRMEAQDRRADRFLAGSRGQSGRGSVRVIRSLGRADNCTRNEEDKTSSVQNTRTMVVAATVATGVCGECKSFIS